MIDRTCGKSTKTGVDKNLCKSFEIKGNTSIVNQVCKLFKSIETWYIFQLNITLTILCIKKVYKYLSLRGLEGYAVCECKWICYASMTKIIFF